jgi:kynurenine formamidase
MHETLADRVLFFMLLAASAMTGMVMVPARGVAQRIDLDASAVVDLTHAYSERTIYWPAPPAAFELKRLAYGKTKAGYFYAANAFCTPEHGGTHLDAPIHFDEAGQTADQIPLRRLIGQAIVLDGTAQALRDRDYRLGTEEVLAFERQHGRIPKNTIVLLRTGWSRHWPDRKAYMGDDTPGDASKLRFPGYGEAAARLLVEEREVGLLGIDTASIDFGRSTDFVVHRIAAARNVPALENLTNLDKLPARGTTLIALPMKIEGGTGGPVRVVAIVSGRRGAVSGQEP